jgi:hypothetical protein
MNAYITQIIRMKELIIVTQKLELKFKRIRVRCRYIQVCRAAVITGNKFC